MVCVRRGQADRGEKSLGLCRNDQIVKRADLGMAFQMQ